MTDLEVLKRARALISTPEAWCKSASAMDGEGNRVESTHINACRWCMWGALRRADPSLEHLRKIVGLLNKEAYQRCFIASLVTFNDLPETTHEQVLEVMDAAIDCLISRGEGSPG